ncbi:MAG: hypothetical protein LPK07_09820 [Hymenobacteraceae bacterium]|nr:hypothetical protein [Hymenobacteraceae bacterium]
MKKLWMLLLLSVTVTGARAQTAGEWFQQKKTQKEYLLEQLAALRLYAGYAQQGYAIAREGLSAIGDGKTGEYGLHTEFFRSLGQVRPAVGLYWKVAAVMALQEEAVQVCLRTRQQVQGSGVFSAAEVAYAQRVVHRLLKESTGVLEELLAVTTAGTWVMGEEERLRRLEAAHRLMLEHTLFARRFEHDAQLLAASRLQEQEAQRRNRILYGITPDVQ